MKTPVVIIHSGAGASLAGFYEAIQAQADARFHQGPHNYYPELTDEEASQQETFAAHANHANDKYHVDGKHVERIVR